MYMPPAVRRVNCGGDDDLLDSNLVHNATLGVDLGADNATLGRSVIEAGARRDSRGSRSIAACRSLARLCDLKRVSIVGAGDRGRLDVVNADAVTVLGASRRVALRGNWCDRGDTDTACWLVGCARLQGRGVLWAILHGDVTAEAVGGTAAIIVEECGGDVFDLALALLGLGLQVREMLAVLYATGQVSAVVHSGAERVRVPAVNEIGVVAVAGGIAVGPDELSGLALEGVSVPDGLVEEGGKTGLETLRALAAVNQVGVCHVGLSIVRFDVLAVPARREEDLGANTVGAVGVEKVLIRHKVAVARALGSAVVVEAIEAKRLLHERLLGHVLSTPGRRGRVRNGAREVAHT